MNILFTFHIRSDFDFSNQWCVYLSFLGNLEPSHIDSTGLLFEEYVKPMLDTLQMADIMILSTNTPCLFSRSLEKCFRQGEQFSSTSIVGDLP